MAEDRRDCYGHFVVTDCASNPRVRLICDPTGLSWHEVRKVDHYWLSVDAVREPMRVREEPPGTGGDTG